MKDSFLNIKKNSLNTRLLALIEQYTAVNEQLRDNLDSEHEVKLSNKIAKLERNIKDLEQQLNEVEQQIKGKIIPGKPNQSEIPLGTGDRWSVLVGVNQYEDRFTYQNLSVCIKDAEAIYLDLIASGYSPRHTRMITDNTEVKPTRNNVLNTLNSLANAAREDDLLLFYYSGHGDFDNDESYLVTSDGFFSTLSDTALPIKRIVEIMQRSAARAKIIIIDACHSGSDIGGSKGIKSMSAEFISRVFEKAEGLAILASCKQGQLSYEWSARERSVFTHYLLEALSGGADRDKKNFVTVQDVNRYVSDGVRLWASQHNLNQTPTLQYQVAGDIILTDFRQRLA